MTNTAFLPMAKSTLTPSGSRSGANWIVSATREEQEAFLENLTPEELRALPFLFEFWALDHQLPPEGDWRSWVVLGGRGAGKTRAGSEWVRMMAEGARPRSPGRARRIALVAETQEQAREVMVFGESGILACSPPDRRPTWIAGRKMLVWPNGATAMTFSAHEPEALRGPQFDAAWVDELAKWKKADETWQMLQFGVRLGDLPQVCVTTTPRNSRTLKDLMAQPSTVLTHAPTEANRANLATSFLDEVHRLYAGSRLGRQELEGEFLSDVEGALWTTDAIEGYRVETPPAFDRVVVAVDPSATGKSGSDACGIVVVGAVTQGPPENWRAYVIEDATVNGASPLEWARAAVDAAHRHNADRLVAEVNQGGDMVGTLLRQVDPLLPFKALHATKGKAVRAEPVAALYEQGRVRHLRGLAKLEDQMCLMTPQGFQGQGSPDRLDALVWAMTELLIEPARVFSRPNIRML